MGELIKTTSEFPLAFSVIGTCGLAGARLVIIVFSWLKLRIYTAYAMPINNLEYDI